MYNNQTYEAIKERILKGITINVDKREGSFINDMISPLAVELTRAYIEFDNIINIAFVVDSYGEYLDKKVNEFGVTRKEGVKASGLVKIRGVEGTLIPKGTIAVSDGLRFVLEAGVITGGITEVRAEAQEVGKAYNVLSNTINKLEIDIFGVQSVVNEANFTGGIDRETDVELKDRFFKVIRKPITSGNVHNYEQWALDVDGVGNATVKPLWNGPGTVKVLISDSNNQPVTQDVITRCSNYIAEVRPIGATVTVATFALFNLTISVDVTLSNGTLEIIKKRIEDNLKVYFKGCTNEVVYTKVGGVIAGTDGVADYKTLTINGGTANVTIPAENIINLTSLVVS